MGKEDGEVQKLTGVGCIISAAHSDKKTGQMHGHSYEITAWYNGDTRDAVATQRHLQGICMSLDHTVLPPDLAWGEELAQTILRCVGPPCVEVEVRRPLERLYAKATAR